MRTRWNRWAAAGIAVGLTAIAACDGITGPTDVVETFDFDAGAEGWSGDFVDYPVGDEADHELLAELRALPAPLDTTRRGFLLSGENHSDDLFMYVRRRIDGLEASTAYDVRFEVEFASDAPTGCPGVGGSPGESVYVKAGASADEPVRVVDEQDHYRLSIDKGNQAAGGDDAVVLGTVATSNTDCAHPVYELKTLASGAEPLIVTTDADGDLWIVVGIESGFEATSSIYFTRIRVDLDVR